MLLGAPVLELVLAEMLKPFVLLACCALFVLVPPKLNGCAALLFVGSTDDVLPKENEGCVGGAETGPLAVAFPKLNAIDGQNEILSWELINETEKNVNN